MNNREKILPKDSNYINAIKLLENKGIRNTRQRKILAKLIFEKGNRHFTAEELFKSVNGLNHKISLATIYNTLKQFSVLKLIREVVVDQNISPVCLQYRNN